MTEIALSEAKRTLLQRYASGRMTQSTVAFAPRPAGINAGLSLAQEQVWRRAAAVKDVPSFYNESITIHRSGPLHLDVLECSFAEVIRRHEIWRTTFHASRQGPVQVVHRAPSRFAITNIDLSVLEERERWRCAMRLATEHAREPFDLEAGPLVRAVLITLNERTHKLFVTMHQSVVDGVSAHRIFPLELIDLYNAFDRGESSPLPKLTFQFSDFAYNDRQRVHSREWNRQIAYWKKQLSGFTGSSWTGVMCEATAEGSSGKIQPFTIRRDLHRRLRALCVEECVSLFAILLAGLALLFTIDTGDREIAIGTVAPSGRERPETQQMLGYFLNPVALRLLLSPGLTVRNLLYQCRDITLKALENDDVPFELIEQEIASGSNSMHGRLLPIAITLAPSVPELSPGWRQTPMDIDTGWAKWPLYLELRETPLGLLGRAQYSTSWFTCNLVDVLLRAFERMLEFIADHVSEPISTVPRCLPQSLLSQVPA